MNPNEQPSAFAGAGLHENRVCLVQKCYPVIQTKEDLVGFSQFGSVIPILDWCFFLQNMCSLCV